MPRSQDESHHLRFVFSGIYGYLILHRPAAGLNGEVSGVFSHCFLLLGSEWGERAKGRLSEDSEWELEGVSGVCRTERGFGEQLAGCGKLSSSPPHHSLMSLSLHQGLVCLHPSGRQWSPFPLAEKHRQYPPLKGLFCCLCPLLPQTTSIPEAVPA